MKKGRNAPVDEVTLKEIFPKVKGLKSMVLLKRIERSTSPLPRECSTTELQQPMTFKILGLSPKSAGSYYNISSPSSVNCL